MVPGISIIICCYNSSGRLPETLRHISDQKMTNSISWEVVLVDNVSTDDTVNIAERIWDEYGNITALRIIPEPRQGLSFARETGVRNATHDVIIFCDDDNWLAPDYLQVAYEIMTGDEKIGICGGVGKAVFEHNNEPSWFERYKGVFACHEQAEREGYMELDYLVVYGAGMIIRRDPLLRLINDNYPFLLKDRTGGKLTGGHDNEIALLYRLLGYKLYYSPRLRFEHYMPEVRMQWPYLKKIVHGSALGSAQMFIYADVLRYHLTGKKRYEVSWIKDILKAINSTRTIRIVEFNDVLVAIAKLSGGLYSVVTNIGNYTKYKRQVEQVFNSAHKED